MRLKLISNGVLLSFALAVSGCGLPDWADSALSSGSEYGPVPQPVTRGSAVAKPARVVENLNATGAVVERSANPNADRLTQAPKLSRDQNVVAQRNAELRGRAARVARATEVAKNSNPTVPTPNAPKTQDVVINAPAAPAAPARVQPRVVAQAEAPTSPASVTNAPRANAPRVADVDRSSPTPMIAAMTRNQKAPRFSRDGETTSVRAAAPASAPVVEQVRPNIPSTDGASARLAAQSVKDPVGTPDRVIEAGQPVFPTGQAGAGVKDANNQRFNAAANAAAAGNAPTAAQTQAAPQTVQTANALQQQPVLADTYRRQLAAGGLNPAALDVAAPGGRATAPQQFPSTVAPNVAQNYVQSLQAPRTYQQAVGAAPVTQALSTVVIGGDERTSYVGGPVIVGGRAASAAFAGAPGGRANAVIRFGHNSAGLSSKDIAIIRRVATQAMQTGARVRIVGHASSKTGEMAVRAHLTSNLRVSAKRADAVADAMARAGVPYDRIFVEARGDNNPAFNEAMPSGEAGNRRAEIFLEN